MECTRTSKRAILLTAVGFLAGLISDRMLMPDTVTVYAQQQPRKTELVIGSETVSIGMAQAEAMAKFSGKYKLMTADPSLDLPTRAFFIMQKDDDVLGSISFKDGKLMNAERDWGAFYGKDGIDRLWTVLDGALSQKLPLNTWLPVQIRRTEIEAPKIGSRTIDIRFDDRTIQLQKGHTEGPPVSAHYETYSVNEIVPFPLF